ncbi:hypothetical protein [Acidithiobacillus ferriphilus]|uniref:hypothetical protein n=1 Tax=Acidithiobacillus ferriphilus TaxID=1689834 RepID=UPI001C06F50D|nr:hypothetical protein [Acidithiobacillus ferriphilus]MBU2853356.1 hypothetical protein [Acidithiobacillus ferriphilus]
MEINEALANLEAARNTEEVRRQEQLSEPDDEMDDELGTEFVDPSLGHVMHLMDLLDFLSGPAPEPRPVHRP